MEPGPAPVLLDRDHRQRPCQARWEFPIRVGGRDSGRGRAERHWQMDQPIRPRSRVPLTGITEAVFARMLSSQKAERVRAAGILTGPSGTGGNREEAGFVDDVRYALYAAKIVAYAQGFEHLQAGSDEYGWRLDLGALATIWRGGCIIRAQFLDRIRDAYAAHSELPNLMLAPFFQEALASAQPAWRRVIKRAVDAGVPVPALSASLAYYDGYRRGRGPANLIQGLRDYFGSHSYRRGDRESC